MPETLLCGQVANAAAPATAAGEFYYLSSGYGNAAGTATPLLIETDDIPPAGPNGRTNMRRVAVPVRYAAAAEIKSTVITDFVREETGVTQTYPSPAQEQEDVIDVAFARVGTTCRVRIEVLDCAGRVTIFTPTVSHKPMTGAAARVVETVT